jgi:hypothetical protein
LQSLLDLQVEPASNAEGEQLAGGHEKKGGWHQSEDQKRDDELGLELGPDDFALALVVQFDQVFCDENDQHKKQNQDDVEHRQNGYIIRYGGGGFLLQEIIFNDGQSDQSAYNRGNDLPGPPSFCFSDLLFGRLGKRLLTC